MYTKEQMAEVRKTAFAAPRARQEGKTTIVLGSGDNAQKFVLTERGYCARFVRQVYEAALDLGPYSWKYAAGDALEMCKKLDAAGFLVSDGKLVPGDIVGINKYSGAHGHIAIYVGKSGGEDMIAENTSSAVRGNPRGAGTKLTPYSEIIHRVTGVYRLGPGAAQENAWPTFRSFVYVGNKCVEMEVVPGGDHRRDQGKVYWRTK